MPIKQTLAALAVLLVAITCWLAVSSPGPATLRTLSAEMAPAKARSSGVLPNQVPTALEWRPLDQHALAQWHGPYWLRWRFSAADVQHPADLVLHLSLPAASQLYWNGKRLADNGTVGQRAGTEEPGRIDTARLLPSLSQGGVNELVVLASSHHRRLQLHQMGAAVRIAPVEAFNNSRIRPWLIAAFFMGALGVAWLYFLVMQRDRSRTPGTYLLLALGLVGLVLPIIEASRPLLGYDYPWHGPRLLLLQSLHLAAAVLLPAYIARHFSVIVPVSARIAYLALLVAALLFLPSFDGRSAAVLLSSLLATAYLLLRARDDSGERWPIMALVVAGALVIPISGPGFLDGPYFLLLAILMGFLLLRHAVRLRTLDRHNAWLREEHARLSLQLLQRGIHPHWLMNTLTGLQELIEQSPSRASRLVESLAEQFGRLREASAHVSIPLDDEIALCRSHLDVVGQALDRHIDLEVDAEGTGLLLPPGILHVQVENALTHAGAAACAEDPFRLRVRRSSTHWILELRSARGRSLHRGQGMGMRYIEASLTAAFPGSWTFSQCAEDGHWRSRMELACGS